MEDLDMDIPTGELPTASADMEGKVLPSTRSSASAALTHAETDDAEMGNLQTRPGCMSFPYDTGRVWWDLLILAMLLFVGITMPMYMGFDVDTTEGGLLIVSSIIDFSFMADMFLQFITPFKHFEDDDKWVTDRKQIAKHYCTGWFWIDFPTCVPLDLVTVMLMGGEQSNMQYIKILRILRIARLLRGLRFLKVMRLDVMDIILSTLGSKADIASIKGYVMSIVKLTIAMFVIAHIALCIWWWMMLTWRKNNPELSAENPIYPEYMFADTPEREKADLMHKYLVCLFFAIQTMTTVGYGDVVPRDTNQRLLDTFIMWAGATIFGYMVGNMSNILDGRNLSTKRYHQEMDELLEFCEDLMVPKDIEKKMMAFYNHKYPGEKVVDAAVVLNDLPEPLQFEMALFMHRDIIRKCSFLANSSRAVTASLVRHGKMMVAHPGDMLIRAGESPKDVYFLYEGRGDVLMMEEHDTDSAMDNLDEDGHYRTIRVDTVEGGTMFGDSAVLQMAPHNISVQALVECTFMMVPRGDFLDTLNDHPEVRGPVVARAKAQHFRWVYNLTHDGLGQVRAKEAAKEGTESIYLIEIYTSSGRGSSTNSDSCFIQMIGSEGTSEEVLLLNNPKLVHLGSYHHLDNSAEANNMVIHSKKFQRGCVDTFRIKTKDVGDMKSVRIGHGMLGADAGWKVDTVIITVPGQVAQFDSVRMPGRSTSFLRGISWKFNCNGQWMSSSAGDQKMVRQVEVDSHQMRENLGPVPSLAAMHSHDRWNDGVVDLLFEGTEQLNEEEEENMSERLFKVEALMLKLADVNLGKDVNHWKETPKIQAALERMRKLLATLDA